MAINMKGILSGILLIILYIFIPDSTKTYCFVPQGYGLIFKNDAVDPDL